MTTIFHRAYIQKEKLKEIILKNPTSLLDGLRFIDLGLGAEEEGVIDFLGINIKGQLIIVNFDSSVNDLMLVNSLSQMQWLKKNEALIKRLFFSENVDFSQPPRILLIGPGFSEKLKSAVKQCLSCDIKLLEFKYIVSQDKDAIIFEEEFSNKVCLPRDESKEDKKITEKVIIPSGVCRVREPGETKKQEFILEEVTLSPQEIAEFMDFEEVLNKKKISQ